MMDLLTIAEAQIAEKQVKEIEKLKERLDNDREIIKKAIELVESHTLYKKINVAYNGARYKYLLATPEMLKEDYLKEPEGFHKKGIYFYENWEKTRNYNTGILEVNGEKYYDIRYALQEYENSLKDKKARLDGLQRNINELTDDINRLKENFPTLKQAITEWQAYTAAKKEENNEYDF